MTRTTSVPERSLPTIEMQLALLKMMMRVRMFEEKVLDLFLGAKIPGFSHVSIGQEAVAAGVCLALRDDDYITSTHRGHGHCVAKGMALGPMFAELMGKANGTCKGKGGSMHIADFQRGVLGANGIVGGGIPIATGAALSAQIQRDGRVCVCFFGDGAMASGAFHESLNLAALWRLPVIYVCENNLYGEWSHYSTQHSVEDLSLRGIAYGIAHQRVDGMDVLAVHAAAHEAVQRARAGDGPTLLECVTYRYHGHSIGGPKIPRPAAEEADARSRDPLERLEFALRAQGVIEANWRTNHQQTIAGEIAEGLAFANAGDFPHPDDALRDLFV